MLSSHGMFRLPSGSPAPEAATSSHHHIHEHFFQIPVGGFHDDNAGLVIGSNIGVQDCNFHRIPHVRCNTVQLSNWAGFDRLSQRALSLSKRGFSA